MTAVIYFLNNYAFLTLKYIIDQVSYRTAPPGGVHPLVISAESKTVGILKFVISLLRIKKPMNRCVKCL